MQLQKSPDPKDSLTDGIGMIADGLSFLGNKIKSVFAAETKTASKTATPKVASTAVCSSQSTPFTNVGCMLRECGGIPSFDVSVFDSIYRQTVSHPETYEAMLACIDKFRSNYGIDAKSESWEDILKFYMERAASVSFLGSIDGAISVLNTALKAFGCDPISGTQTIALSAVWGTMLIDLTRKSLGEPGTGERKIIAGVCVSLLAFLTQIAHRELPYWSYIGTVYKSFAWAGDLVRDNPRLYKVLFPNKYIDIDRFPTWHKELEQHIDKNDKLNIAKAFNIHYTFRIGDVFIAKLGKPGYFDESVKDRLKSQLSPIPTENELRRLFALYTKPYIYY